MSSSSVETPSTFEVGEDRVKGLGRRGLSLDGDPTTRIADALDIRSLGG